MAGLWLRVFGWGRALLGPPGEAAAWPRSRGLLLGLFLPVRSGRAFTETWGNFMLDNSIENGRQPCTKWP